MMKTIPRALVLGAVIGLMLGVFTSEASNASQAKQLKTGTDEYAGPIVDYDKDIQELAAASAKERELREERGHRYNQRAPDALGNLPSNWEGFATGTDWYLGVAALPLDQSDVVIVGNVASSEAHLSNDRTGVYSEFSIGVNEVLRNRLDTSTRVGDVIVGAREGGVVRFQGGRLFRYTVFNQGMPRPGRQYLFFLSANKQGGDYDIVTAYELSGGQVVPLDDSAAFAAYKGSDQQKFLGIVREAIRRAR
jgi:hypothetical protein